MHVKGSGFRAAVHFTLDMRAVFCYCGIRSSNRLPSEHGSCSSLPMSGPLFRDIHHGQVQHFQQAVIGRKYRFRLGYLAQLPVEPFNCVGGIDQPADFLRIFEIGAQIPPVGQPGLSDFRVFPLLSFSKTYRAVASSTAAYTAFKSAISAFRSL